MEPLLLLAKTILLRPYVFVFLAAFLWAAIRLLGWPRTWRFWLVSWGTAFICEFSSTRTGFPFGWYHYTGSTVGQELYISNIPFMDSLSFSFLLYAAYCLTLSFLLPRDHAAGPVRPVPLCFDVAVRTGGPALLLTALFYACIDIIIDPVALRGDRWFLGKIYYYPDPGTHFGVPLANYVGWAVVGLLSLSFYFPLDRRLPALPARPSHSITRRLLPGVGLYYGVLAFNLGVTFWIGEDLLGMTGILMFTPVTALLLARMVHVPAASADPPSGEVAMKEQTLYSEQLRT